MKKVIGLLIVVIVLAACQPQGPIFREATEVEIDEHPREYRLMATTLFTITDAAGKVTVLQGPLIIEAAE